MIKEQRKQQKIILPDKWSPDNCLQYLAHIYNDF